jgi:hypothetical protein
MAHHDCANEAGCGQGALYLIAQPIDPGAYDLATSADRLEGTYANGYLGGNRYGGFTLAGGNDLNGDGFPDLAFGAPYADSTYVDSGAAYVLFGGGSP